MSFAERFAMEVFMRTVISILCLTFSISAAQVFAQEPTKEQRAQMAEMHEKAAACLRSEKSFDQCHKEMWENCPMAKDGKSCPMMGMMHHGRKMRTQK